MEKQNTGESSFEGHSNSWPAQVINLYLTFTFSAGSRIRGGSCTKFLSWIFTIISWAKMSHCYLFHLKRRWELSAVEHDMQSHFYPWERCQRFICCFTMVSTGKSLCPGSCTLTSDSHLLWQWQKKVTFESRASFICYSQGFRRLTNPLNVIVFSWNFPTVGLM